MRTQLDHNLMVIFLLIHSVRLIFNLLFEILEDFDETNWKLIRRLNLTWHKFHAIRFLLNPTDLLFICIRPFTLCRRQIRRYG